jgi:glycine dehydrogenase subunit 1
MTHPYMANSGDDSKQAMLDAIGAPDIATLFAQIPQAHRLRGTLDLPPALPSETALKRHLVTTLARNRNCEQTLNFLGAGCWQHHVPAVCDEVARRTEWLTSVFGSPMSDHGRNQAWFEFCSQIGELVGMEMVGLPVYSWGCAIGHAARMASRLTGRSDVIVLGPIGPERMAVLRTYCGTPGMSGALRLIEIAPDAQTGCADLAALQAVLTADVAAVYIEVPSYLGLIETAATTIAGLARARGAEMIVGVDPISLGVLPPPADYGADIVVGTTQPLGVHMNCGGGVGGFIATRDEERYAREYPTLMISIAETIRPGEYGFGLSLFHQTSYGSRDQGKDWTGNSVYMWAVVNAAYMALLGPQGFRELGELIVQRAAYAAHLLAAIPGLRIAYPTGFFKEFVVDFSATGRRVADVNRALLAHGIFGGKDLSAELPQLGESALYCVTELHEEADLERLAAAIREIVGA